MEEDEESDLPGPMVTSSRMKRPVEIRRGEKYLISGKKGGVKSTSTRHDTMG